MCPPGQISPLTAAALLGYYNMGAVPMPVGNVDRLQFEQQILHVRNVRGWRQMLQTKLGYNFAQAQGVGTRAQAFAILRAACPF